MEYLGLGEGNNTTRTLGALCVRESDFCIRCFAVRAKAVKLRLDAKLNSFYFWYNSLRSSWPTRSALQRQSCDAYWDFQKRYIAGQRMRPFANTLKSSARIKGRSAFLARDAYTGRQDYHYLSNNKHSARSFADMGHNRPYLFSLTHNSYCSYISF